MNSERRDLVAQVMQSALQREPGQRAAFLDEACAGDEALRSEVESLLSSHDDAGGFLEVPPLEVAFDALAAQHADSLIGQRIGPFQIQSFVGSGGMGEVYRATDTRLGRMVAIKVLPAAYSTNPEWLGRFEREARAAGQLNHPNVLTVYDVGIQDSAPYIIAELLDGENLRALLQRGRIPQRRALDIARQIASGLAAAHAKGIVHRDLKPENLFVTSDGRVKILDFGLAKLKASAFGAGAGQTDPTAPAPDTVPGTILGTVGYMSPEQVRGEEADARSDLFVFGVILHELLSGNRPFQGESAAEVLHAILKTDPPDLNELNPQVPRKLARLVLRCLEKVPAQRFQSASDLAFTLEAFDDLKQATPTTGPARFRRGVKLAALIAVTLLTLVNAAVWMIRPDVPEANSVVRFDVPLSSEQELSITGPFSFALSQDSKQIAYVDGGRLYIRTMDAMEAKPLPGTDGASLPFFSPDGKWIGFRAKGKLMKIPTQAGSPPEEISSVPPAYGACWGPDDYIYYTRASRDVLVKVPATGGAVQAVTTLDSVRGESSHRWPQILPGGKAILFTAWTGQGWDERHIHLHMLDTGDRLVLVEGGSTGRYLASGHILYSWGKSFRAVPFDLANLKVTGTSVLLDEEVMEGFEGAPFAVSETALAYVPVDPREYERKLVWVDREGNNQPLTVPSRQYSNPAISPDGRHAAVNIAGPQIETWIYDFSRDVLTLLTTPDGSTQAPVWTDATHVAYRAVRSGYGNLAWKAADGSGEEERLTKSENLQTPASASPDGKWLAFNELADIWLVPLHEPDRKPRPLLATAHEEANLVFSPDARWVAYESNESGSLQVYVRPFPDVNKARWSISSDGGNSPVWARDGRELYYRGPRGLMAVRITTNPAFVAEAARRLFAAHYLGSPTGGVPGYDVSRDGRFLMVEPTDTDPHNRINVVLNWAEELGRKWSTR